jgi:PKD repeat protein
LRVPSYSYAFTTKGVYKVTFVAKNANSLAKSEIVKSIIIKVE